MQETLWSDIEKCLHAYEASSAFSAGSVDWKVHTIRPGARIDDCSGVLCLVYLYIYIYSIVYTHTIHTHTYIYI